MPTISKPTLKIGSTGLFVSQAKAMLRSQGGWTGSDNDIFGEKMRAAVQYFQSTHLAPNGEYLDDDGEIGPDTWWALSNPSGVPQRSNIAADLESGFYGNLCQTRKALIKVWLKEHASGVHEIPDGSNGGDGVEKYIEGFGPVYWCCLFQSWAWKQVTGRWPLRERQAHVQTFWNQATEAGIAIPKAGYDPVPGDMMVWRFTGGAGHISGVFSSNASGSVVNTIGGNEGNRVKLGIRTIADEPRLIGYINLHDDWHQAKRWTRKIFDSSSDPSLSIAGTR